MQSLPCAPSTLSVPGTRSALGPRPHPFGGGGKAGGSEGSSGYLPWSCKSWLLTRHRVDPRWPPGRSRPCLKSHLGSHWPTPCVRSSHGPGEKGGVVWT